jgi:hypothetical protein
MCHAVQPQASEERPDDRSLRASTGSCVCRGRTKGPGLDMAHDCMMSSPHALQVTSPQRCTRGSSSRSIVRMHAWPSMAHRQPVITAARHACLTVLPVVSQGSPATVGSAHACMREGGARLPQLLAFYTVLWLTWACMLHHRHPPLKALC